MTDIAREPDLIERWLEVKGLGYHTISTAAERLGVTRKALERAIERARKAEDPRIPQARNESMYRDLADLTDTYTNDQVRLVDRMVKDPGERQTVLSALGLAAGEAA